MTMTATRGKISRLINFVASADNIDDEKKSKVLAVLEDAPMTRQQQKECFNSGNDTLIALAEEKSSQRIMDTAKTLCEAVDAGVETIEQFAQFLRIPDDGTEELMDQSHIYNRIGEPGRPDTALLF